MDDRDWEASEAERSSRGDEDVQGLLRDLGSWQNDGALGHGSAQRARSRSRGASMGVDLG